MSTETHVVNEHIPVRQIDVSYDTTNRSKHFEVILDLLREGVYQPRGGGSGPDMKRPGMTRVIFAIEEKYADEYWRRMGIPVPGEVTC